jgi:methyl-accepting chemotaxis protein
MKWFSNLKIGARMLLSFGLVVLAFIASTVYGINGTNQLKQSTLNVQIESHKTDVAHNLAFTVAEVFERVGQILIYNNAADTTHLNTELATLRAEYKKELDELVTLATTQKGKELLAAIDKAVTNLRTFNDQVLVLQSNGKLAEATSLFRNQSDPAKDEMTKSVEALLVYRGERMQGVVDDAEATRTQVLWILIGLAVLDTIFGGVIITLATRDITNPIKKLTGLLGEISKGNLKIAVDPKELERKDEIGIMTQAAATLIQSMRGSLGAIQDSMQMLASASTELSSVSEEMAAGANETASNSDTASSAAEQLSANTLSLADDMDRATGNLASVASATEEMTATIGEIASNSEKARATTMEASQQADSISGMMKELGRAAQEIGKVTETITSISAQTNLLALNATIEAARAGAAGKGFAVVANEIKELAQQTAAATSEIKSRINSVQESTVTAVNHIEKIVHVIRDINDIVNSIATAIEEQSVVTRDIAGNIAQASISVKDSNKRANKTADVTKDMVEDISNVSQTMVQMKTATTQVQTSATELSGMAENLREMLNQYAI